MKITIQLPPDPPIQDEFNEDDIRSMIVGRRQLATEWKTVLYSPKEAGQDWSLILPFSNTYQNAFACMCESYAYPHQAASGKLCLYLKSVGTDEKPSEEIYQWIDTVGKYVVMKDFLALSCALDYERKGGNPNEPQTEIGALRSQAKPYGAQEATSQTTGAAGKLAERCMAFLSEMTCYESADCLVAMPPSDPSKEYNLPRYLTTKIAEAWGRPDMSRHVQTTQKRTSLKSAAVAEKLKALVGTIKIDKDVFHNKNVLLIDDLYQSGISMNYCALMLLKAGARKILGLACEKTCRNDDNVGGR